MASRCDCGRARGIPLFDRKVTDKCMESLVWFADGCRLMLESLVPDDMNMHAALRAKIVAQYSGPRGLDRNAIKDGLIRRFGAEALSLLSLEDDVNSDDLLQWPSRYLTQSAASKVSYTDRLQALAGLCCNDVRELLEHVDDSLPIAEAATPRGYGSKPLERPLLPPEAISDALSRAKGRLGGAAAILSVTRSQLVVDAVRQAVRVPMTDGTRKRLGAELIERVRGMLRSGVPKCEVCRELRIGVWTRMLIEADDLELPTQHRDAVIKAQQARHRTNIEATLAADPTVGRSEIAARLPSAYDWAHKFDFQWFRERVASARPKKHERRREPRKDWVAVDRELARQAIDFQKRCLASNARPRRITKYRILKGIGFFRVLSNSTSEKFSELTVVLDKLIDSHEAFLERRLRWAMTRYKRTGHMLSMNQFRRLIAWSSAKVVDHIDRIVALARELGVPLNPLSIFAVHQDEGRARRSTRHLA